MNTVVLESDSKVIIILGVISSALVVIGIVINIILRHKYTKGEFAIAWCFSGMGLLFIWILGSIPGGRVLASNKDIIENHYNIVITSEGNTPFSPEKDESKLKEFEISFTNNSSEGELDKFDGEIRVRGDKAALFYAPDSPDEMVPYEAE